MRIWLLGAWLLAVGCRGGEDGLAFVGLPSTEAVAGTRWSYPVRVRDAAGSVVFSLVQAPVGMTLDGDGWLRWRPDYEDLGSHLVRLRASDDERTVEQAWLLRVSQGVLLGTALSPRRHTLTSSAADFVDHYENHAAWGGAIAFHLGWREDGSGVVPTTAISAMVAGATYGFTPVVGFGWADGSGAPDLTSDSEPANNSWTNAETRAEFRAMVREFAKDWQPPWLFLGNETNAYFVTHSPAEWEAWISQLASCYVAVKAVSPDTLVFTTFQWEMMRGEGANAGWSFPAHYDLLDALIEGVHVDAIGFTSYPYLEYDALANVPDDHYAEIAARWAGPVAFTEIGWLAQPSPPYPGNEAEQADFVDFFFDATRDLPLAYAAWLFLHDWDQELLVPSVAGIGLRNNDGTIVRAADARWRAAVALRE